MLPYLEQQPLYSACNFNWDRIVGNGQHINTRSTTPISTPSFALPMASRHRSEATTSTTTTTSGAWGRPRYLVDDLDGDLRQLSPMASRTSPTAPPTPIAFAEGLVGDTHQLDKWRDGMAAGTTSPNLVYDANQNHGRGPEDLQTCTSGSTASRTRRGQDKGWQMGQWLAGSDHLQHDRPAQLATQYPWSGCRYSCGGCGVDFADYVNANSNHPGGCNFGFCDGSVRFIKSTISMPTWWALGPRKTASVISSDHVFTKVADRYRG